MIRFTRYSEFSDTDTATSKYLFDGFTKVTALDLYNLDSKINYTTMYEPPPQPATTSNNALGVDLDWNAAHAL